MLYDKKQILINEIVQLNKALNMRTKQLIIANSNIKKYKDISISTQFIIEDKDCLLKEICKENDQLRLKLGLYYAKSYRYEQQ